MSPARLRHVVENSGGLRSSTCWWTQVVVSPQSPTNVFAPPLQAPFATKPTLVLHGAANAAALQRATSTGSMRNHFGHRSPPRLLSYPTQAGVSAARTPPPVAERGGVGVQRAPIPRVRSADSLRTANGKHALPRASSAAVWRKAGFFQEREDVGPDTYVWYRRSGTTSVRQPSGRWDPIVGRLV
jgi:hypothetical protein